MIHLSRRHSIILASSLIGLFFVVMWGLSTRQQLPSAPPPQRSPPPALSPQATQAENAQFQLNEFHRSEVKNGKKIWEVKATHGQYFPERQMVDLREADVWVFRENGEQVFLKAPEASLILNGTELQKTIFPQLVHVVYNEKITLDTSAATYDKGTDSVYSDNHVTVVSDLMELNGERFIANLAEKKIVFSGGVQTIIKAQQKK